MQTLKFTFIALLSATLFMDCDKDDIKCCSPITAYEIPLELELRDTLNQCILCKDSFLIHGVQIAPFPNQSSQPVDISTKRVNIYLFNGNEQMGQTYHKDYLLTLPVNFDFPYDEKDQDTISFDYIMFDDPFRQGPWYDSVWIYFNQKRMYEGDAPDHIVKLIKY